MTVLPIYFQMNHKRARNYDADVDDSDSAPSVDSTGKRKSFRRLIIRFAEKTSMQGVPYINNAKLLGAKIIWSFLLLIALIALGVHLWYLFTQFYEWPVQTKVELGFSNLRFPDVTICNTNPIHKKRFEEITGVRQLKKLVQDLNPRNLVPEQFDANFDPLAEASTALPNDPPAISTPSLFTLSQGPVIDPNNQQTQSTGRQTPPITSGTASTPPQAAPTPPPTPPNGNQPSDQSTSRTQQQTNTQAQSTEVNNPPPKTTTEKNQQSTQPPKTKTQPNNQPQGTTAQPNNHPQGTSAQPNNQPQGTTTQHNNNRPESTPVNNNNNNNAPPSTTNGQQTTQPVQNGKIPPPPPVSATGPSPKVLLFNPPQFWKRL